MSNIYVSAGDGVVCWHAEGDDGTEDEWNVESFGKLTPDEARAVADALYQAAFEIDGKGATVAELTAQLEQARAEIERYKQATNSLIEKWKTIAGYQSCDDDSCDDDNPYNTVVRDLESVLIGNNDPQCLECVCDNDEPTSESVLGNLCNAGRQG